MFKNTVITGLIFLCLNYTYFGSLFGVSALSGSIYLNSFFQSTADIIGPSFVDVTSRKFDRRVVFIVCFIFVVIFSLSIFFVQIPEDCDNDSTYCAQKIIQTLLASLIKIFINIGYGSFYCYMNEIFPTVHRGIGITLVTIIGRIGNILAPFMSN